VTQGHGARQRGRCSEECIGGSSWRGLAVLRSAPKGQPCSQFLLSLQRVRSQCVPPSSVLKLGVSFKLCHIQDAAPHPAWTHAAAGRARC